MRVFGPPTNWAFGGLCHCAKFGGNRCSIFDSMQVLIFCELDLKTPIQAPKLFFGGGGQNSFLFLEVLDVVTSVPLLVKIDQETRP